MSMMYFMAAGNLGRDAEVKSTRNGKMLCTFSIAVDSGWGDNKETYWITCNLWGDRGEKLSQYLTKGTQVVIRGRPSINKWENKSGEAQANFQVDLDDVTLMGGGQKDRNESGGSRDSGRQSSGGGKDTGSRGSQNSSRNSGPGPDLDDGIPGLEESEIPF